MKVETVLRKAIKAVKEHIILVFMLFILLSNQIIMEILTNNSSTSYIHFIFRIWACVSSFLMILLLFKWITQIKGKTNVDLSNFQEKINYLANYDQLTELPNRVLFIDKSVQALYQVSCTGSKAGILFADINRFKIINDTFGHSTGDLLLREVSNRLKNCIREEDIISRVSGDLFSILICNLIDENEMDFISQKILSSFYEPFNLEGYEIFVSLSLGISMYPFDGQDIQVLMKNADIALNNAKENGTNNYKFYKKTMNDKALEKATLETALRKALEKEEFFLVFQPQMDLKTGDITGVEALLRWKHPVLGTIPPVDFIPLTEETGLIVPIGEWVLKTACKQIKKWHSAGFNNLTVSVNVSTKQFEQPNIVNIIHQVLKDSNLEPRYLKLELTESIIMKSRDRFLEIIYELRKLGVNVAIDDFGTGFSSLSYLKKFDVDQLKIDKSFINEICIDYRDEAITAAIIDMAHNLNLDVLAEGVETKEQYLILKQQNCDKIQGYYFSRPQRAEDLEQMLKEGLRIQD